MSKYPIARLNNINPDIAQTVFEDSRQAIIDALNKKQVECPTCWGARQLGSFWGGSNKPSLIFDCPNCNGIGAIIRPVFGLFDFNGGWGECPYCFEGMENEHAPCEVCFYWLEQLDSKQKLPRTG